MSTVLSNYTILKNVLWSESCSNTRIESQLSCFWMACLWQGPKIDRLLFMTLGREITWWRSLTNIEVRFVLWKLKIKQKKYLLLARLMVVLSSGILSLVILTSWNVIKGQSRHWIGVLGKMVFWPQEEAAKLKDLLSCGIRLTQVWFTSNKFQVR